MKRSTEEFKDWSYAAIGVVAMVLIMTLVGALDYYWWAGPRGVRVIGSLVGDVPHRHNKVGMH